MSAKQIEKELTRQLVLFDEECKESAQANGHIKFEMFGRQWYAEQVAGKLANKTQVDYEQKLGRVYKTLGHLYLDKITVRQLQKYIDSLSQPGANLRDPTKGLSPKSVKEYLCVISDVFEYAVQMEMLPRNPCRLVKLPPMNRKEEKRCFTLSEAQTFLDSLTQDAPLHYQVFFSLALFGGFRREELYGFEFTDFDFDNHIVTVRRASLYTVKHGVYTAETKTEKSHRALKLPAWIFDFAKQLRAERTAQRLMLGDQWHESGRLFTKADGSPATPDAAYNCLQRFCENKDLPFYGIHSFRHLNASLLIFNGEDIRTVSAVLGHAQTSTTLNIYAHTFAEAQARASAAIADKLPVRKKRDNDQTTTKSDLSKINCIIKCKKLSEILRNRGVFWYAVRDSNPRPSGP